MSTRKISIEDEAVVVRRYINGDKPSLLAREFHISPAAVSMIMKRNGIDRRWGRVDMTKEELPGFWTVLEYSETKNCVAYWKCRCACGVERAVSGPRLRDGTSLSCGCKNRESTSNRMKKSVGYASQNAVFLRYQRNAKRRSIDFNLTLEQFVAIATGRCYYCGCKPSRCSESGCGNGDFIYNGVDRLNSDLGYDINNIVPACCQCNVAKNNMSVDKFLELVRRINNHWFGGPRGHS